MCNHVLQVPQKRSPLSSSHVAVLSALPGYPAALSAFVSQPPKQNDVLQDLLCGQLGEMFTGNVLYQHLGIQVRPWATVWVMGVYYGWGMMWLVLPFGVAKPEVVEPPGVLEFLDVVASTKDHFLVLEVGDRHRRIAASHRLFC